MLLKSSQSKTVALSTGLNPRFLLAVEGTSLELLRGTWTNTATRCQRLRTPLLCPPPGKPPAGKSWSRVVWVISLSMMEVMSLQNKAEFWTTCARNLLEKKTTGNEVWQIWNWVGWGPLVWGTQEWDSPLLLKENKRAAGLTNRLSLWSWVSRLIKVSISTLFN